MPNVYKIIKYKFQTIILINTLKKYSFLFCIQVTCTQNKIYIINNINNLSIIHITSIINNIINYKQYNKTLSNQKCTYVWRSFRIDAPLIVAPSVDIGFPVGFTLTPNNVINNFLAFIMYWDVIWKTAYSIIRMRVYAYLGRIQWGIWEGGFKVKIIVRNWS